jgi:23S rRNA (pseudouridine1915-N3)-methyltransferase
MIYGEAVMKITIISVGKIKEKFFTEAAKEYIKRLSKYCRLIEEVVPDEKADDNFSPAEIDQVKIKEGQKILNKIPKNSCDCFGHKRDSA